MATRQPSPSVATPTARAMPGPRPLLTLAERLRDIELMRQRVNSYAEYMAGVGALTSTSTEAKERAVVAFHERMAALESQLARIHEELRLG